jgi:hypothetical protein
MAKGMKGEDLVSMIDIAGQELVGSRTNDLRESPSQDNRNGCKEGIINTCNKGYSLSENPVVNSAIIKTIINCNIA